MNAILQDKLATIRAMKASEFYFFPFRLPSGCGDAILDPGITLDQFRADPRNRLSESGYEYTERELGILYSMVEYQRQVLAAAMVRFQQVAGVKA